MFFLYVILVLFSFKPEWANTPLPFIGPSDMANYQKNLSQTTNPSSIT